MQVIGSFTEADIRAGTSGQSFSRGMSDYETKWPSHSPALYNAGRCR
ncbi:MAG: hypothetical protein NTV69_06650 [Caldilinea sp.]|jgi:hypothetical protein|nr:hypothetical protein [Caldilinea sp.]